MLSAPPNWDLPPLPALLIKAAGLALPPLIRAARLSRLPEKTHIWFVVLSPAPLVVETRPTNLGGHIPEQVEENDDETASVDSPRDLRRAGDLRRPRAGQVGWE